MVTKKYNPGFLTDDELVASFCVRTSEFESIIETLGENTGNSNQHLMVIGPRGSGKTNLMLRVAIESRRNPELSSRVFPVTFAEESYEVSTCGEFWLECLSRLADQAPQPDCASDLGRTCQDLRAMHDDRLLAERCLGALLDFSDRAGKRLLIAVENLNAMFAGMLDPDAGWRLRKTLQTEPRIMLLGTATSRFEEIDRPDRALYDLFRVIMLPPLDETECSALWQTVSGERPPTGKIRSLQILTGGSPRLISIVAAFSAGRPLHGLMEDLLHLIDVHTEYFKSHLDALAPQERRVCIALGAVETGNHARNSRTGSARFEHLQRPTEAPHQSRVHIGRRRNPAAQAVLSRGAAVQHLLPAPTPTAGRLGRCRASDPLHDGLLHTNQRESVEPVRGEAVWRRAGLRARLVNDSELLGGGRRSPSARPSYSAGLERSAWADAGSRGD